MALYDLYEAYRSPALSRREQAMLDKAGADGNERTRVHMRIACDRAQEQLSSWALLPEDSNLPIRFPGVDPVEKYCVIDLKLAHRRALLSARLQTCPDPVRSFPEAVEKAAGAGLETLRRALAADAAKHRILTRASKLCLDENGRRQLHLQARALESGSAATASDLYFQGLEYVAGLREGPVLPDVAEFYADTLDFPIPPSILGAGRTFLPPAQLTVSFFDFSHRLLQLRFSDPKSWGSTQAELEAVPVDQETAAAALPAYAAAAVSPVLDAAFRPAELGGLYRADLLRVDGLTVREHLAKNEPQTLPQQQLRGRVNLCVAAALMAGRRVEALLPGCDGAVPEKTIPILRTDYAPGPEEALICGLWEQFSVRQGFCRPEGSLPGADRETQATE